MAKELRPRETVGGAEPAQAKPVGLNRRYLRVQDLRRLGRMAFRPMRRVEGHYAGKHATPLRGHSIEFRDYRQYLPGDDVGSIDWKVYGRSDRLFIRLFEHQSESTVRMLVDASASMGYYGVQTRPASPPRRRKRPPAPRKELSKYDLACHLAAALGFLLTRQQDRFSFAVAQRGLSESTPARGSMPHLVGILDRMERTLPFGVSALASAIRALTATAKKRDLLVLFSDLLDDPNGVKSALAAWRHRGGEAIVFHTLHADELNLPDLDAATFVDSETAGTTTVHVADIRDEYRARIDVFLDGWRRVAVGLGMGYQLVTTAEPYAVALERFLVRRSSLR